MQKNHYDHVEQLIIRVEKRVEEICSELSQIRSDLNRLEVSQAKNESRSNILYVILGAAAVIIFETLSKNILL